MSFLRRANTGFLCVLLALVVSMSVNLLTVRNMALKTSNDPGRYSYSGDDYPIQLPLYLPTVSLVYENTERFGVSDLSSWSDWRSTDAFPKGNGFVKLGPQARLFGLSMFHQLHCLQMIRHAILAGDAEDHVQHCLNMIRQAILCAADTTLDPLDVSNDDGAPIAADGVGQTHMCRDWDMVYQFVNDNQLSEAWNVSKDAT
ncbi:uncharacterized protein STEHIDRAFT_159001 [Stereum hirsutum FP-91666 SS1]|uniref:uncharacterized protein n=1 Tax=Stereum hirsutum (strain FP-91666) TaxID=721885 RepID=UPI0004449484|nr:uncharacterized protein STEHIDRAFT_159001 [Stereum hirsutum FP-91666 SS1]EIM84317.1 hypothetical protein STEHIDRAFT_159001 [Stereum hirsutum FP-91666 SS1]